jgi:hypothetical protein
MSTIQFQNQRQFSNQIDNEREIMVSKLVHTIFDCKGIFNSDPNEDDYTDLLTPYERSKIIQREIVEWILKIQTRE